MSDTNTIVISPHKEQSKVLTSQKRIVLALAGIQAGKTWIGCVWAQMEIQKNPQGNGLICGLSHDQVNNVVMDKFFTMFPSYKRFYKAGTRTLELPTGGKVFFRSLEDPKYVEGITAHWEWIDEADLVGYKGYMIGRGRVNATNGRILMTSSIADNSWLADYATKMDDDLIDVISWSSVDNPAFSKEEFEALRKELDPALFRRRYEAKLDFASGRVYGNFQLDKHKIEKLHGNTNIRRTFIGIDWGYVDPTAIVFIGLSDSHKAYVLKDFGSENLDIDIIVAVVRKFIRESQELYGCSPIIYADPSNKLMLKSVAKKLNHDILPGNNDIFSGTAQIRNLIWQDRFFVLQDCKKVLREIRLYRFKEKNFERKEEPEDANNHWLDAVRYVLATYPLSNLQLKKESNNVDLPDFWLRRTPQYRQMAKNYVDPNRFLT